MSNDKIQQLRKRGRWSFVIKYGILTWGLGSSLLASVAIPLIPWVEYTFTQLLAITLPTFCACGILFGLILWRVLVASGSDTNGAVPHFKRYVWKLKATKLASDRNEPKLI